MGGRVPNTSHYMALDVLITSQARFFSIAGRPYPFQAVVVASSTWIRTVTATRSASYRCVANLFDPICIAILNPMCSIAILNPICIANLLNQM